MLSLAHLTGRAFCMSSQKQKDHKGSLSPTARQGQAEKAVVSFAFFLRAERNASKLAFLSACRRFFFFSFSRRGC